MARVVQGLSGLILAGVLVHSYLLAVMLLQLYLAGPNDVAAESWKWHAVWGYFLGVPILLLVALTLIGRLGLRVVGFATLLAAMFAAQLVLNVVRFDAPYLPVLYAANGLAMVGLTAAIDRSRSPDDDVQRLDADPESTGDHRRLTGSQVIADVSAYRLYSKCVTTHENEHEISVAVPAGTRHHSVGHDVTAPSPGSPPSLAVDLVRGPMQAHLSPRGGRETHRVRIDKGVKDERVRI